ncbi:MAG: phage baseplate assembly protein [Bosea sp.]|uniref:phage baseplate assembly protein domain-containing protein n=1 Tax=unclassified Bosea (in: a-proteobacteria) TaxID=2653178 RepID=UPI000961E4C8|nr:MULTISPECIES: phage baseplate assembly protein [unclassified Bosea (in: a-proteobacteria)]MBN9459064.1 phage baseplate assembly protein [Bosea sp. (in: a-proteobacteria)]OJV06197.1 MAG: hypothetical protein BGO20_08035 [Bosea sp. 67-29]
MSQDQTRAMISRGRLMGSDDSGDYQKITARGFAREELEGIVRHQQFGLSSNPGPGSEGLLLRLGGRAERTIAILFELLGARPRSLPVGATALYNAFGLVWKLLADKADLDHGGKNLHARGAGKVKVEASDWIQLDGSAVYLGKPPYSPVMTQDGPSQHVFAGIGPAAPDSPAGSI